MGLDCGVLFRENALSTGRFLHRVADFDRLEGNQSPVPQLANLGGKLAKSLHGIHKFHHHREIGRKTQNGCGPQDAVAPKTHRTAKHRGTGQSLFSCHLHENFEQGFSAQPVFFTEINFQHGSRDKFVHREILFKQARKVDDPLQRDVWIFLFALQISVDVRAEKGNSFPMDETLTTLLALQARDAKILSLRQELTKIPVERKNLEQQQKHLEQVLESAGHRLKQIEVEKKDLELQAQSKREQISRYKTQQMQTRKNEEYAALGNEIKNAETQVSLLEDREIELMEETERLQPEKQRALEEFEEGKRKLQLRVQGMEQRVKNLEEEIATLTAARTETASLVEPDLLETYTRLFASKHGTAIVPLEGDVCTGCHMRVPSQTVVDVKAGKSLTHCPLCGRILYLP